MSSELRVNKQSNRVGLGTVEYTNTGIIVSGIVTATSFKGDGSALTGIDATQIVTGNTSVQTVDTGSDGHVKVLTEGSERLRILSTGNIGIGTDTAPHKLSVKGTISKISGASGIQLVNISQDGSNHGTIAINQSGGVERIKLHSSGDSYFNGGRLLLGTTTNSSPIGWNNNLQVAGTNAQAGISIRRDENGTGGALLIFGKSRGSLNGNTVVQSGDQIGGMYFAGADGTDVNSIAAQISVEVDGTPGGNDMPGRLLFKTTADGAASPTERLRITAAGDVGTGGIAPTTQSGRVFHLHAGAAQQRFHMTNNTTGSSATDGFEIIVEESANVRIRNFEAGNLMFDTGGSNNEAMRITSAGKVLIGTTTPQGNANADDLTVYSNGHAGITIRSATSSNGNLFFADGISGGDEYRGWVTYEHGSNNRLTFGTNAGERLVIASDGDVLPGADNTQDLGSSSKRWANLYTGDLHLSNSGSGNSVDGTSGSWTMQEGESDLFLINNKTGKKYKINLTEIS